MKRRLIRVSLIATGLLALTAAPTLATHTHVLLTGNGKCVILAQDGGEKDVNLPVAVFDSNPNVDVSPVVDRNDPLHVLVHQGVPGEVNSIAVYGSDAGNALCGNGYVGD